jgi:ribosomal protein S18 acetylase RimI-like enzyme
MFEINSITSVTRDMLKKAVSGYNSLYSYKAHKKETADEIVFSFSRQALEQPFIKKATPLDADTLRHYQDVAAQGLSYAASRGDEFLGLILAEPQRWNNSLVIREFGVSADCRRTGVGEALMSTVIERVAAEGFRCITCETQTTNFPAISFYKKSGFDIDGVDLFYYTNDDVAQDEIAVFMRKKL